MAIQLDCHGITHVGKVRPENEDQFLIADLNRSLQVHQTSLGLDHQTRLFGNSQGKLLVVADGMGGHEAGERASMLAVDGIATYVLNTLAWFFRLDQQSEENFKDDLRQSLVHCQEMLNHETNAIPQRHGMGTTLTMAYVIWPRMYVVHAGDSRCYVCRRGKIEQITSDHTIGELYRAIGEGEPPNDRSSRALWNVIGGGVDDLIPEVSHCNLQAGDSILLCTDGLTLHLSDEQIAETLDSDQSSELLANELVEMANDGGGKDNITVVLAKAAEKLSADSEFMEVEEQIREPLSLEDSTTIELDASQVKR